MSTDDAREKNARWPRWPLAPINTVLVALCVIGGVACLVLGHVVVGIALLLGGVGGGIGAALARRGASGDLERVNALEYADERDRSAGVKGLAAVGALSLALTVGQLLMHALVPTDAVSRFVSIGVFFALVICWFTANWYFVRRG